MPDEAQILELLDRLMDSGETPEQACVDYPELLPEVRERFHQCQRMEAQLAALFPSSAGKGVSGPAARRLGARDFPVIPGYEVESVVGRGGMGLVYKARQLKLNRPVAVKMLLSGVYASPAELARFLREAEAIAGLNHPNVVQVHGIGDLDGCPYFTMEFMDGGSLGQKLGGIPQPATYAADVIATLATAIEAAHRVGIVHRDLKPSNVLLTAEGTLKIADFGLARHLEGDPNLTMSGAPVGTPSYMAPEQTTGKAGAVGAAVDVYALGAILYEMLTGRPPFRGETPLETQRQVVEDEPVHPCRLNPNVPRDLETICLKCLQKDPERRYESAAALAADVHRFLRDEPITARRVGLIERLLKWVHRRPAVALAIAACVAGVGCMVAGLFWLQMQRMECRQAVENDLRDMVALEQRGQWDDARAVLATAQARLGGAAISDARDQIAQAQRDFDLLVRLDHIRLTRVTSGGLEYYRTTANHDYEQAFGDAGLTIPHEPPQRAALRIDASPVRLALLAAVDDWMVSTTDSDQRNWLMQIAETVAPDQLNWRQRLRQQKSWDDEQSLRELGAAVPINSGSVTLLLGLGERIEAKGSKTVPQFMFQVQQAYPADFWANLILGDMLLSQDTGTAGGYYRAALASRPDAAVAYNALGDALRVQRRFSDSLDYYHRALDLELNFPRGVSNIAGSLAGLGRWTDAIDSYREALRLDPNYLWAHYGMGNVLRDVGSYSEAAQEYRTVIRERPFNPDAPNALRRVLIDQDPAQIRAVYQQWCQRVEDHPSRYSNWAGLSELALYLGDEATYSGVRAEMLRRFGDITVGASDLARTAMLRPGTDQQMQQAAALAARGSTAGGEAGDAAFSKGLAEYRLGHWDAAMSIMTGDARQTGWESPRFVTAMALARQGELSVARHVYASGVANFDWNQEADRRDIWSCYDFQREAESVVFPDLGALIDRNAEPVDQDERLAMILRCKLSERPAKLVSLYAAAFAADPALADHVAVAHRARAARAAALAAAGVGDAAGATTAQREAWRQQAWGWLKADLAAHVRELGQRTDDLAWLRIQLVSWMDDPALAGLRDPTASPEARTFWNQVVAAALWRPAEPAATRQAVENAK